MFRQIVFVSMAMAGLAANVMSLKTARSNRITTYIVKEFKIE